MKQHLSINDLAREVETLSRNKRDYSVPCSSMYVSSATNHLVLPGKNESFRMTDHFHAQTATFLNIPQKYYDRLRNDHPDILDDNVNKLLNRNEATRFIRTYRNGEGVVRANLSLRYHPLDNDQLLRHVLPILQKKSGLKIASCSVDDKHLYLKAVDYQNVGTVPKVGDKVASGIIIKNSEVGASRIMVAPFTETLRCTNGMVHTAILKKVHMAGAKYLEQAFGDSDANDVRIFSDKTLQMTDRAFWMQVSDVIESIMSGAIFDELLNKMSIAHGHKIEDPVDAIEDITKTYGLYDNEHDDILKHLVNGGDLSSYGMAQAVTRTAEDAETYERATFLENLGDAVLMHRFN